MRRTETVTAVAVDAESARPQTYQLITVVELRPLRAGGSQRRASFEIRSQRLNGDIVLTSHFDNELEREEVIERVHGSLLFTAPGHALSRELPYPPEMLVGRTVTRFTEGTPRALDRTSLTPCFDAEQLTHHQFPFVRQRGRVVGARNPRFSETLATVVGRRLLALDEYADDGLTLTFDNGLAIVVRPPWDYLPDDSAQIATLRGPTLEYDWFGPEYVFPPPQLHSSLDMIA